MLTPGELTVRKDEGSHNIHTLNTSRPRDESRGEDEDCARFQQESKEEYKGSEKSDQDSETQSKN